VPELRVAVVGAGPAGCFIVDSMLNADVGNTDLRVDLYDRLPTPFGLLRYGVAPDHPRMKSLTGTLQQVIDQGRVRFFGNVNVGADVTVDELREHYHAVVYTFGAAVDRRLGIPGEDLPGSCSATELVAWYSGHPDITAVPADLSHPAAVVVGAGNVAVDVARILSRPASELTDTDMPDEVLSVLAGSRITDVHLLARRGPADAKFTYKELRELGELTDVDVIVDAADLYGVDATGTENPAASRNLTTMREWAARPKGGGRRRLHLHFHTRPVEIQGTGRVEAVVLERGHAERSSTTLPVGLILRAVGYRGIALDGVPFDEDRGLVPTDEHGRVLRDGAPSVGEYAAGWIKRGPRGVLGTNRADADETVSALLTDLDALQAHPRTDEDMLECLRRRGATVLDKEAWGRIDSAEIAAGGSRGCARQKLPTREELLEAGLGVAAGVNVW
jgi:ferredoxin--NADP+ reductase